MEELSQLSAKFSENLLDATNAFAEIVSDEALLAGLPDDVREAARAAAEKAGSAGWKFTLHPRPTGRSCSTPTAATCAPACTAPTPRAPPNSPTARASRNGTTRRSSSACSNCAGRTRSMLGYANFAEVSLVPKMAETPAQVLAFLRELAAKAKPFAAEGHGRAAGLRPGRTGHRRLSAVGCGLRFREAAAGALRLLGTGSEAVLHRAQGRRRAVQGHREPVQCPGQAGQRAGLARGRALLPHRDAGRRPRRPVLPRPLRPRNQARRRLDGRGARAAPAHIGRHPEAGRLPELQLLPPGRREGWQSPAGDLHPRRSHHAVPRKPATACTTC